MYIDTYKDMNPTKGTLRQDEKWQIIADRIQPRAKATLQGHWNQIKVWTK